MSSATAARRANAAMMTLMMALTITYVAFKIWPMLGAMTYLIFAAGCLACCKPSARNVIPYSLMAAVWPVSGLIGYAIVLHKMGR